MEHRETIAYGLIGLMIVVAAGIWAWRRHNSVQARTDRYRKELDRKFRENRRAKRAESSGDRRMP